MRHVLYVAVVGLLSLIVLPDTASARSTPWHWHHMTPIYPVWKDGSSGRGRVYRSCRPSVVHRAASTRRSVDARRYHAGPVVSTAVRR